MSGKDSDMDGDCEFCKKSLTQTTILRHIGQTRACKAFYGPRFKKMKTEKPTLRQEKHRDNLTIKQNKRISRRRRKLHIFLKFRLER